MSSASKRPAKDGRNTREPAPAIEWHSARRVPSPRRHRPTGNAVGANCRTDGANRSLDEGKTLDPDSRRRWKHRWSASEAILNCVGGELSSSTRSLEHNRPVHGDGEGNSHPSLFARTEVRFGFVAGVRRRRGGTSKVRNTREGTLLQLGSGSADIGLTTVEVGGNRAALQSDVRFRLPWTGGGLPPAHSH